MQRFPEQSSQYAPLPTTITHQSLIMRIKTKLGLPKLHSSFISRPNIIQYINKIHRQNQRIRQALNPPSLEPAVAALQKNCSALRILLNQNQEQEEKLKMSIAKIEQDLAFMEEYYSMNAVLCGNLERQIQNILEEKEVSLSHCNSQQMSNLMDRFMGYFEQSEGHQIEHLEQESTQKHRMENSSYMDSHRPMILKGEPGMLEQKGQIEHPKLQIVNYTYTGFEQQ